MNPIEPTAGSAHKRVFILATLNLNPVSYDRVKLKDTPQHKHSAFNSENCLRDPQNGRLDRSRNRSEHEGVKLILQNRIFIVNLYVIIILHCSLILGLLF
jgi:hypothetical protein